MQPMLMPHNLRPSGIVLLIFSAIIFNLGVGCNWWWTLGSSWYCAGRDCTGYQKIVNHYLLIFLLYCSLISFGLHRENFWCKLVDCIFCIFQYWMSAGYECSLDKIEWNWKGLAIRIQGNNILITMLLLKIWRYKEKVFSVAAFSMLIHQLTLFFFFFLFDVRH